MSARSKGAALVCMLVAAALFLLLGRGGATRPDGAVRAALTPERQATAQRATRDAKVAGSEDRAPGWRERIASPNASERRLGAELLPASPGDDGDEILLRLAKTDPDPAVRERAVLSYGSMVGPAALAPLREIALREASVTVRSAARAELYRLRKTSDEQPRGWMDVSFPNEVRAGVPFEVRVAFGSDEDVPRARLSTVIPKGLSLAAPMDPVWRGSIRAGERHEVVFTLVADETATRATMTAALKLDYPELLDFESFERRVRVRMSGPGGVVEEALAPRRVEASR
jgi:hypothetical protein